MLIRNLFFYLAFLPTTIILSALTVLSSMFRSGRLPYFIGYTWGRLTRLYSGLSIEVDLSAITEKRNYLFFANHQSMMDIPILYSLIGGRGRFGFVAKESLFRIPLFGSAMLRAGHIPIDRDNPRRALKSIDNAVKLLGSGSSVVLFPEGTRNTDWSRLKEFQIGGMILALKCGLPVAPLVMYGSGPALPKGSKLLRGGRILVKALPPVDVSGYSLKEREKFKNDMYEMMNSTYLELAARVNA